MDEMIYDYLIRRGATRLCHFTNIVSLLHIYKSSDGILATDFLSDEIKRINDLQRLDNETEYVNCSIEYPNTWYWARIKDKDPIFKDWAFLYIDLSILKERKVKFSPCNAAKSYGAYITTDIKELDHMYADKINIARPLRRQAQMLCCCPTDDQAEILVYKNIPLNYIIGIAIPSESEANLLNARFQTLRIDNMPSVYVAPDIFSGAWSAMIRNGTRPNEQQYFRGEQNE